MEDLPTLVMNRRGLIILFFFSQLIWGQSSNNGWSIQLLFENQPLEKEKQYFTQSGDTLTFDKVKFYISNVEFIDTKGNSTTIHDYPQLIDWDKPESLKLEFNSVAVEEGWLQFTLGVPLEYNTNGAFDGDLDPVLGMYWAWQSGYIFIKMEGHSPSAPTLKHKFQFHLGGYAGAMNALTQVKLPIHVQSKSLTVDLAPFFNALQLQTTPTVMVPGSQAVTLSQTFNSCFRIP